MNALTITQVSPLTMNSREIAELTGKEHWHVMRDIRNMLVVLKKDASSFGGIYQDRHGREKPCFNIDRDLTMTLVSGYDIPLRHRVVTRLSALEAQATTHAHQIPTTWSGALMLAARQAEQLEQQQVRYAIAAHKVEFVDRYVESPGLMSFRQVAKLLEANESLFRDFLENRKVMYLLRGEWTAYQPHIGAGRFKVRTGTGELRGHAFNRIMFTPKGVEWIAGLWGSYRLSGEVAHDE